MPGQTRTTQTTPPKDGSAATALTRSRRDFGSNQDRIAKAHGPGGGQDAPLTLQRRPELEPKGGEVAPAVTTHVATYDRTDVVAPEPTWLDRLRDALRRFDEGLVQTGRPENWDDRMVDKDATQSFGVQLYGESSSGDRSIATKASEDATFFGPSVDLAAFLDLVDTVVGALPGETGYDAYRKGWGEARADWEKGDYEGMIGKVEELVGMVEEAYGLVEEEEEEGSPSTGSGGPGGSGDASADGGAYTQREQELVDHRHVSGFLTDPGGNLWRYDYADGTRDLVREWVDEGGRIRTALVRSERWN